MYVYHGKDGAMVGKFKLGGAKQRIFALIISVAVLIYAVYHITSLFGEDIATIATGISRESRVLDGKGYIFRDEQVLRSNNSGVADYLKADGSKVSIGEPLAKVHSGGTATSKKLMAYYDDRIAILEDSVEHGLTLADLPTLSDSIWSDYYSLSKLLASGETGELSETADKLLLSLNRHSLLTDESSPVDDTLERMVTQRDGILAGGGSSVTESASESGYFYSYADGLEEYFTVSAADSITPESFYELTRTDADREVVPEDLENAYGKLAKNSEWRFVMRVGEIVSAYFKDGEGYTLTFAENGNISIPMTLRSSIDDTVSGGKLLVFFANRLPEGFTFDRLQSVSIQVSASEGIYVPRGAVHRMGGEYFVYVLKGSVVKIRRIEVVYEGTDYFLSETDMKSDSGTPYLDTNELLIINGENLFDGRILD